MNKSLRVSLGAILGVSAGAFAFLVWWIYFKTKGHSSSEIIGYLPALNAFLNGVSALCLIKGLQAIKAAKQAIHKRWMGSAFVFSTLFLMSYLAYHHFHGDSHFLSTGLIRPLYFFTLISHILCTVFALPLILITFFLALTSRFEFHKKIAKWTFPIWMYVSVTGVLIYVFNAFWG